MLSFLLKIQEAFPTAFSKRFRAFRPTNCNIKRLFLFSPKKIYPAAAGMRVAHSCVHIYGRWIWSVKYRWFRPPAGHFVKGSKEQAFTYTALDQQFKNFQKYVPNATAYPFPGHFTTLPSACPADLTKRIDKSKLLLGLHVFWRSPSELWL
jgi:hypothetical protein